MARRYDVVVVGGGNAAFCAAQAARERVGRVIMLEKAPEGWLGGNSYFTAGAFRLTFGGLEDLRPLLHEPDEEVLSRTELPPYTAEDFMSDMERVTEGRCDARLARTMVEDSADVVRWLRDKGIRWRLMYDRQSYEVGGRLRFWGGLVLGTVGGGKGLVEQHLASARRYGIEVRCSFAVEGLLRDDSGAVVGVRGRGPDGPETVEAGAVVLACGGFEANARMRARHLGSRWGIAKVRGTPYNTGEGLRMALEAGAEPYGDWGGCHSIAWDVAAPPTGDRGLTNLYSKQSYPLGIVVNSEGRRFLDEGADFRNYTYARYGAEILRQPGGVAYQIFDAKTEPLLRKDEYEAPGVSRYEASDVGDLAEKMGVDRDGLERTVREFNAAIRPGRFDPSIKDGKRTEGIEPPKSNWALPLDTPPYYGFAVTCGITFTFGGLHVDEDARVLDTSRRPIPGLHAAGELVGGLFYHNYPGGTGLTSGAVFGRRAGYAAAAFAKGREV
ncbi:Fumarate reductase flavoprotein subunit [Rubrobacter xylanophilus DSM 9941]|uniref:FAD-dependent tricarballylate dehydrogenase TcuA n=1 Tax=Rubrobacter xylanophilus TaxID=49319 RepID=UPI001C63F0DC|nr:FAD-dependent tricarballylate dehydrogenase TcuA [Rubrobacter xylanophilus]QYJ16123.1 Fumarate reductase flavoprotein subunit [Rubrobacter xylanophilus DSM 9941]